MENIIVKEGGYIKGLTFGEEFMALVIFTKNIEIYFYCDRVTYSNILLRIPHWFVLMSLHTTSENVKKLFKSYCPYTLQLSHNCNNFFSSFIYGQRFSRLNILERSFQTQF